MGSRRERLCGNRLTLVGAVVYLLEWVGIIGFNSGNTPTAPGTRPDAVLAMYSSHAAGTALLASWLSMVLLGRILFAAGLRDSLRRSGEETLLADIMLATMAASVVLEIAAYALVGAAGHVASAGNTAVVVGLDAAASWVNLTIYAPLAVSVVAASTAQLRSGLFPAWFGWLGLASGLVGMGIALLAGPAFAAGGTFYSTVGVAGFAVVGIWVWMIATGIVLFRHAGKRSTQFKQVESERDSTAT